jgi:hypothetical protein
LDSYVAARHVAAEPTPTRAARQSRLRAAFTRLPQGWLADNWLVLATGLAAALPIIVAVAEVLGDRWVPLADDGIVVLRAWDVLTEQSPLVGQFSTFSQGVDSVYGPGPLLYWLLALPVRLFGVDGVVATIGLVNVASVMCAVALARRRGGVVLMFVTALALLVMCRSLPTETLYSPLNATAPLIPGTLLIFLCWSMACGELRLLPIAVLVGSFMAQSHLAYVAPVAGLLAASVGGFVYRRWRVRGARDPDERRRDRRWVLAALAVGLVC